LLTAFRNVLERSTDDVFCEVAVDKVTVEQRIAFIETLLAESDGLRFDTIFDDNPTRTIVVLTFIALLELMRTGRIGLRQNGPFADIWLYPAAA